MDTTFLSGGGIVTTDVGGRDFGSSIVLQSDAKIIVAGESSGGGDGGFALVRYNADGSLDTTFDGDGKVRTDFGGLEYATSVALQSDGKIIVVGYNGLSSSGGGDFAVVRYNADGSFDTTFDGDGKVTTNLGGWDRAESVTVESGGKILVVGYAVSGSGGGDYALVRYNTDGSIDTTFGVGGKVITNVGAGDVAHSVIVQSDNKIVVIGDTASNFSGSSDFALVRYGADGTLDTTFGEGGKVTTNIDLVDFVGGATVQPDGRIIVVGKSYSLADMAGSGDHDFVIVRYNIDGTLDTSFNFDGKIVADFGGFDSARSVAVQADGKIVVTGSSSFAGGSGGGDVIVVRYNTNGTLDTTFSGDGIIKTAIGDESEGNGVVVQSDGKILVAGASASSGNPDFLLVRYNADGSMAPGIDFDGMPVSTASRYESFADLYVDANQQNLTGYIGSAQVELSPPGVLHCFDEDHDGFADHFTRTWADATGTHNLSGTTTWLDAMVFKSSGSELIGGVTYSVNQYGRLAYDAQGDVVGMFFLTLNPVFTMTTDTIAGDSLVATFTAYDNDDNDIKTWQLLDNNGDNVIDSVKRVGDSHSDYDIVWTDSTHFTAYRYVGMGFGSIFDNQNRPTTIPYYTSGATEQDPDVRNDIPIVWQAKGSDNVVATFFFTSSTNTVSGKLFDTNSDNIPDQISFTETDNGVSHTTMATLIGWSNLSSTNPDAVTGRVLSSNNPDDLFTGLIDGTQSAPTRIYMPSYYMGSSGVEVLSDTTSPTLISSTPADDATHVLLGSDIVLNFSENILAGTGNIVVSAGTDIRTIAVTDSTQVTFDGSTVTINPTDDLHAGNDYHVQMSSGVIKDLAGNSYTGMTDYDFTCEIGAVNGGKINTELGGYDTANALAIFSDGKILVAGTSSNDFALVRYLSDGTFDTSFGVDGKVITNISSGDDGNCVVVQDDGKIVLAGNVVAGNNNFALVRYNADGTLDSTFSNDGWVSTDLGGIYEEAFSIANVTVNGQSMLLVAGYSGGYNFDRSSALLRYTTNGELDTSFGVGGSVLMKTGSGSDASSMEVLSDGRILVAGQTIDKSSNYDITLSRYTADGVLDTNFGTGAGFIIKDLGGYDQANDIVVQDDGHIFVTGYSITDITRLTVLRYTADGVLDHTFGANGQVSLDSPDPSTGRSVTVLADGKILVAGSIGSAESSDFGLFRFLADGWLDTAFGVNGIVRTDFGGADFATSMSVQTNGDIVIAGSSDGNVALACYNSDGTLDASFGGISDSIAPTLISSTPADGTSSVPVGSDIVLNFSEAIQGTGSIEIHTGSSTGAVVASYDLATSPDIIIAGNTLTINPAKELENSTHYFVTVSDGSIEDLAGNSYAGTMSYDFTTAPMSSGHDIGGSVSFWKTGQAISGVTTTLESSPIVPGSQLVELRNIQVAADGSRIIEIWETSSKSDIDSVQLEFTLPTGSVSAWQDATGLPSGWTTVVNTGESGQFILGGMGMTALSAGPIKLGTLTLTAPANPHHFDLSLSAGWLGEDTVPLFGISSDSMTTGPDGLYQHTGMADGTYAMTSVKVSGTAESNAIKANDALAALKMAVGMNPNSDGGAVSPYQYLAADVNQDGVIKAADALNILKMAVKLDSAPAKEWLFVPESVGSETMSRTHVVWPDSPMPVTLGADQELYLIGIVKGDVNGSWVG